MRLFGFMVAALVSTLELYHSSQHVFDGFLTHLILLLRVNYREAATRGPAATMTAPLRRLPYGDFPCVLA
jgi:hypothetical protein